MRVHPQLAGGERRIAWALLGGLALVKLLLHLATHHRYGYFRDEFYYLACGKHLSWGYVDHPPLIALIARLNHELFGDSLLAIRLPPILAMCLVVVLCGWMAGALGGGRYAQALAGLAVVISPAFLVMGTFLSVNAFDILWWTIGVCLLIRLLNGADPRLWLAFGLVVGIGLLTKHTMAALVLGLIGGLALTPHRRHFSSRWPWFGAALAALMVTPHVIWQFQNGWPTLEFLRHIRLHKNYPVSPIEFIAMQFAIVHPFLFPVWLAGLGHFLFSASARPLRPLGWIYLIVFVTFMALRAKFYYLFPVYPMLLAAGGVVVERRFPGRSGRRWKTAIVAALVGGGLASLPYAVPVLPFDTFLEYDRSLGINREIRFEQGRAKGQAIIYADMFGWRELVERVAAVHGALEADEQRRVTILASNYGEAGAVDLFGSKWGIPPAVSAHNSYYLWGPGDRSWDVVLAIGFEVGPLEALFDDVVLADTARHAYARQRETPIYICRRLKTPIDDAWRSLKTYR